MQNTLEVTLVQTDLIWENPEANRNLLTKKIAQLPAKVDIVVLPEMFTTGFTMQAKAFAEFMTGKTVAWMLQLAQTHQLAITGSIIIEENKKYYNRLLFVEPFGKITFYNKRHAFTLVGEDEVYTSGKKKVIINYKGWKICPLICYDLRFPVWSRNVEHYDLLIYVANWPKPRVTAWTTLLKARAIENMSYCIGVNRIGVDGVNCTYTGHSAAYNVLGDAITNIPSSTEQCVIVTLNKKHITAYRNTFNFLNDKDTFTI